MVTLQTLLVAYGAKQNVITVLFLVDKDIKTVKINLKRNNQNDPLIKSGQPLPNNGTCQHYKKSFRWMRFPCCGKVYPCDKCHNEAETEHEMEMATRMICGFCSKEQVKRFMFVTPQMKNTRFD